MPLPARRRHGDGTAPRLRVRELGNRLRRLPHGSRHGDPAPVPLAREDRHGDLRHLRGRLRRAGARRAASDPEGSAREGRGHGIHREDGFRARVLPLQGRLRRARRARVPRRAPFQHVHHGLPHAADHQGRVDHPSDPQPHAWSGHPGRVLQGGVRQGPARDQHHLFRCAVERRPPLALQARRQGDRGLERRVGHLHGEMDPGRSRFVVPRAFLDMEREGYEELDLERRRAPPT